VSYSYRSLDDLVVSVEVPCLVRKEHNEVGFLAHSSACGLYLSTHTYPEQALANWAHYTATSAFITNSLHHRRCCRKPTTHCNKSCNPVDPPQKLHLSCKLLNLNLKEGVSLSGKFIHCESRKQDTKLLPITSPKVRPNRISQFFH